MVMTLGHNLFYLNTAYVSWFILFKYDLRVVVYFNYFI